MIRTIKNFELNHNCAISNEISESDISGLTAYITVRPVSVADQEQYQIYGKPHDYVVVIDLYRYGTIKPSYLPMINWKDMCFSERTMSLVTLAQTISKKEEYSNLIKEMQDDYDFIHSIESANAFDAYCTNVTEHFGEQEDVFEIKEGLIPKHIRLIKAYNPVKGKAKTIGAQADAAWIADGFKVYVNNLFDRQWLYNHEDESMPVLSDNIELVLKTSEESPVERFIASGIRWGTNAEWDYPRFWLDNLIAAYKQFKDKRD